MAFLEAMACGLPLVCREDASLKGVLEAGENGFIYRDEGEFMDAILKILGDDALRARMREKALLQAEASSDERFVERTLALYASICSAWAAGESRAGRRGKRAERPDRRSPESPKD